MPSPIDLQRARKRTATPGTRTCMWMLLLAVMALLAPAAYGQATRPNIVVIVADDLGWGDVGFHGATNKTPNLDRLARGGVELEQHYVAPMCSPTRAALLSGRYWSRFGITGATNNRVMPFDTVTLASALRSAGYETALTGKWHLGSRPEWGPRKYGFDHTYGSLAGGVTPNEHRYKRGPYTETWHRNEQLLKEKGHVTDLIAAEAVRWLEQRGERPFFLYVPFTAVHIPIDEPEEWLDLYPDLQPPSRRQYAACLSHFDAAVGRIVRALERTGKRDNTLLVFFSDNGAYPDARNDDPQYPGSFPPGPAGGTNLPLRGRKTQVYEGGIRVPAFVHWPGRLKPGKVSNPMHVVDWMPTLCNLAGYRADRDLKWDGRDLWPRITGKAPAQPRTLYWEGVGRRTSALRHGDWKLVAQHGPKPGVELFDLARDPEEKENLADRHPERVDVLRKLLDEQRGRDNDAAVPPGT